MAALPDDTFLIARIAPAAVAARHAWHGCASPPRLGAIAAAFGTITTALGTITAPWRDRRPRDRRPITGAIAGTIARPIAGTVTADRRRDLPASKPCWPSRPRWSMRSAAPARRLLLPNCCATLALLYLHALAMRRIVLPVVADVVHSVVVIDVEVAVAPVAAAAPVIAPASDRPGRCRRQGRPRSRRRRYRTDSRNNTADIPHRAMSP